MCERWRNTDQKFTSVVVGCCMPTNTVPIMLHVRNVAVAFTFCASSPAHKKPGFFLGGLESVCIERIAEVGEMIGGWCVLSVFHNGMLILRHRIFCQDKFCAIDHNPLTMASKWPGFLCLGCLKDDLTLTKYPVQQETNGGNRSCHDPWCAH